jgi:hypothetical protein
MIAFSGVDMRLDSENWPSIALVSRAETYCTATGFVHGSGRFRLIDVELERAAAGPAAWK